MMNREQYIAQLRVQLYALPAEEQDAAIEYYNNYFDDAGQENEQQVIAELGTPEELAAVIKADFACVPDTVDASGENPRAKYYSRTASKQAQTQNTTNILLLGIILILTFPVWFPIALTLLILAITFVIVIFAILLAVVAAAVAVLVGGIAAFVAGIFALFTAPAIGLLTLGAGLVLAGLGLLGTIAFCWVAYKVIPALIRGIVNLCSMPLHRKGGKTV